MTSNVAAILQSGNLFVYTMHNPVMFIDPSGLAVVLTGSAQEKADFVAALQATTSHHLSIATNCSGQSVLHVSQMCMDDVLGSGMPWITTGNSLIGNLNSLTSLNLSELFALASPSSGVEGDQAVFTSDGWRAINLPGDIFPSLNAAAQALFALYDKNDWNEWGAWIFRISGFTGTRNSPGNSISGYVYHVYQEKVPPTDCPKPLDDA